jgi:hypothetical protein
MSKSKHAHDASIFDVSGSMAFFSWLICEHPRLWKALGKLESAAVEHQIEDIQITKPIYVSGLARSGSTILLELLAESPGVISQRYKDFPPVFTPYAWNSLLKHTSQGEGTPSERAHKDGIMVTMDSPEAMEEPVWSAFFPHAHDPARSNVISPGAEDGGFRQFYSAHIRKILAVRGGQRYLAKGNYQVTRLEYLLDLFPDARFVLPVRDPAAHIASLMKQHNLFTRGQTANPRARDHLRRVGHFEFGIDRVPINTGDNTATQEISEFWDTGAELEGWMRYWNQIYGYLAERVEANPALAKASKFVEFEQLCARPVEVLSDLFAHCELDVSKQFIDKAASRIEKPTYYKSGFSDMELVRIAQRTGATLDRIRGLTQPVQKPV